jgi:hypothetical protein
MFFGNLSLQKKKHNITETIIKYHELLYEIHLSPIEGYINRNYTEIIMSHSAKFRWPGRRMSL